MRKVAHTGADDARSGIGLPLDPERSGDPRSQLTRARIDGLGRDDPPKILFESVRATAGWALVEMGADRLTGVVRDRAVEKSVDLPKRLFTLWSAHLTSELEASPARSPVGAAPAAGVSDTMPLVLANSYNSFCNAFLPRWSRLMTVPIGTSRISAISL